MLKISKHLIVLIRKKKLLQSILINTVQFLLINISISQKSELYRTARFKKDDSDSFSDFFALINLVRVFL